MNRWFSEVCKKYSNRLLVYPNIYYKDFQKMSEIQKEQYMLQGVKPGSKLLLNQYNSVQFLSRLKALWEIGATTCIMSPKLSHTKKEDFKKILLHKQKHDDKYLMTDALCMLTSGTTAATPKVVKLSHSNIQSHIEMLREHIPDSLIGKDDRTFSILPWTHCYGLLGECFSVLDRGASMGILSPTCQQEFSFPVFFKDLHMTQPTILFVVPHLLEIIMKRDAQMKNYFTNKTIRRKFWFGSKLRYIVSGGAYLRNDIRKFFWDEFEIKIIQGYGCTEMSPMIALQNEFDVDDHSVGKLLPNIQVRINTENEILVNGPNRFLGYSGSPPLEYHEFYNTKDLGYVQNDRLYLTGRTSNMVKLSNGKFVDISHLENNVKDMIPYAQDVCIWCEEDGRFAGIVHTLQDIPYKRYNVECFHEDIDVIVQNVSFTSPINGTLTQKGEKCRPMIKSIYGGKNKPLPSPL